MRAPWCGVHALARIAVSHGAALCEHAAFAGVRGAHSADLEEASRSSLCKRDDPPSVRVTLALNTAMEGPPMELASWLAS